MPEAAGALLNAFSEAEVEPGRNGLVEGVGRDVLEVSRAIFGALFETVGDILEGKVPALPLRAGLLMPVSVRGTRSGKPSAFGDSGISNSGVDVPLVGGPQMFEVVPVGVCNSLVRLGNNLEADSCRGEPEPTLFRFSPAKLLTCELDFGPAKGDLLAELLGSTIGDKPERLMFIEPSALELGPMLANYSFTFSRFASRNVRTTTRSTASKILNSLAYEWFNTMPTLASISLRTRCHTVTARRMNQDVNSN